MVACLQYLIGISCLLFESVAYGVIVLIIAVLNTLFSVRDFKYSKEVLVSPVGIVEKYQSIGGLIGTLIYNVLFGGIIGIAGSIYGFVLRSFVMSNQAQFMQIEQSFANSSAASNNTLHNNAPQNYTSRNNVPHGNTQNAVFFTHTCSGCGHTFKVQYNRSEGQTKIPDLSVNCPRCKSKEIIKSDTVPTN